MSKTYKRMLDQMEARASEEPTAYPAESWWVYILECGDGTYYTGITKDLDRRLDQHNSGKGARYTRSRRPVRLRWSEPHGDRPSALVREYKVKAMTRAAKEKLIESDC